MYLPLHEPGLWPKTVSAERPSLCRDHIETRHIRWHARLEKKQYIKRRTTFLFGYISSNKQPPVKKANN